MTTVDLFKVEAAVDQVRDSLKEFASKFSAQADDYSDQGAIKAWRQAITPHVVRLAEIHTVVDQLPAYREKLMEQATGELYPIADPSQAAAVTAAELTAARWMGRGLDLELIHDLAKLEPSPARTIVFEEAKARDVISTEDLELFATGTTPELSQARREAQALQEVETLLKTRLSLTEERTQSHRANPMEGHLVSIGVVLSEGTVELPKGLTQWAPPKLQLFSSPAAVDA